MNNIIKSINYKRYIIKSSFFQRFSFLPFTRLFNVNFFLFMIYDIYTTIVRTAILIVKVFQNAHFRFVSLERYRLDVRLAQYN